MSGASLTTGMALSAASKAMPMLEPRPRRLACPQAEGARSRSQLLKQRVSGLRFRLGLRVNRFGNQNAGFGGVC